MSSILWSRPSPFVVCLRASLEQWNTLWGRPSSFVVCLRTSPAPCTGPLPILFPLHQLRFHRIALYITNQVPKFVPTANPVVERLVLPEGRSGTPQNPVCDATGSTLQPSQYDRQRRPRLQDHMDVVGHDHPSVERVELTDCLAVSDGVAHDCSHSWIAQPNRADLRTLPWEGAGKAPGDEDDGLIRNPMRQPSPVKEHAPVDERNQTTENDGLLHFVHRTSGPSPARLSPN